MKILRLLALALSLCSTSSLAKTTQRNGVAREATFVTKIPDAAAFLHLARTYHSGDLADHPHLLFIVERATAKTFYADGASFDFHGSFARAIGLTTKGGKDFFRENYTSKARPLILGTLVLEPKTGVYYFEYSDADHIDAGLVRQTADALKKSFFAPLVFRANSLAHEEVLPELKDMKTELANSLRSPAAVAVHHKGQETGVLTLGTDDNALDLTADAIALFDAAPVSVAPVRGLITEQPSSPLSHLHMLARIWKIPDVTQPSAKEKWGALAGKWVTLTASGTRLVELRTATAAEIKHAALKTAKPAVSLSLVADLKTRELKDLFAQRRVDGRRYGAKSAQLGEISSIAGVKVPPGFSVPFVLYSEHFASSGAKQLAFDGLAAGGPLKDLARRKAALEAIRAKIQNAPMATAPAVEIAKLYEKRFKDKGVFVRSSTNAEDLPQFNGAGLYTTVPNVITAKGVVEAVKTVWASVWNLEAFEAREAAGILHLQTYAGVLIQLGISAESAGVLVTRNPFNAEDDRSIYINAKKGLGIRVVNGHKVPEQLLFNAKTGGIKVLSRSDEDAELVFAEGGGVKDRPLSGDSTRVLTRPLVKDLVRAGNAIERRFDGRTMDVEWVVGGGIAYIVQGRPYPE